MASGDLPVGNDLWNSSLAVFILAKAAAERPLDATVLVGAAKEDASSSDSLSGKADSSSSSSEMLTSVDEESDGGLYHQSVRGVMKIGFGILLGRL